MVDAPQDARYEQFSQQFHFKSTKLMDPKYIRPPWGGKKRENTFFQLPRLKEKTKLNSMFQNIVTTLYGRGCLWGKSEAIRPRACVEG